MYTISGTSKNKYIYLGNTEKYIYVEVCITRWQNKTVLVLYFIIPRSGDDLIPIMN